ncbi:hypothetical protein EDC14_10444 [Hydrogenispora ethanolica]|jgi:hypothetical protein|uniref:Uncharacterized protein n=1 Tax=Hydrogenispora ethanolica TaxID=1082276 RepID=A0A4R1QX90_HYDET|nr:hypothetical protein [Hydrogenispora ethanolica]TCL57855.1 hypothetical protein EDC14_10444 [Hydrogenispora ethanolica]
MSELPREIQEIMERQEFREAAERQPGSRRFKAMVLGLSTLHFLKEQEKNPSQPETEE